jgi:hypothetical protein
MDSRGSGQGQVAVSCEDSNKLTGSKNCGQILDADLSASEGELLSTALVI